MNTTTELFCQPEPDFAAIKAKQKSVWEDGDYHDFAAYMHAGAVEILDGWDLSGATTLLDVACGSGQTAIPAARKGLAVTGIDIAENLIEKARQVAAAAEVDARFDVGDAEALPYADCSFDAAISLIGAMFAPRPERVVAEFVRVIKPGGRLFMANWTATSMPARMFRCASAVVPAVPGTESPLLWGDEETVHRRLGTHFLDIRLARKLYPQWHYPFDEHGLIDLFREKFGPVKRAFAMATPEQERVLYDSLLEVYRDGSETRNGILTVTAGEYLEVTATRR